MRFFKTVGFALKAKIKNRSRISLRAYLKGHKNIHLGRDCKIHDSASIDAAKSSGIFLGNRVTINRFAYLQGGFGEIRIGDCVEINNYTIIDGTGGVDIGANTLIGPGVSIISYQHQYMAKSLIRSQLTEGRPIKIGSDVWIGANTVILAGITIGDGAVVGAGAVVTHDVPPYCVVMGVPARIIKKRD